MLFLLSFLIVFVPFILVLIYYFPIVAITTTSSMAANNTNILCLSSEKSEVKNQPHCVKTKVSAGLCSLFQSGSVEESTSLLFPTIRDYLYSLVFLGICIFKVICVPPSYLIMTLTLLFLSCLCDYITPLDKPA